MDNAEPFEVPSGKPARGRVTAPPSKSHAIRLVVAQAVAEEGCFHPKHDPPLGDDVARALSVGWGRGPGSAWDLGGSGTAYRFFCAVAALKPVPRLLTGDASLRRRPMDEIVDAVRSLRVTVEPTIGPDGAAYAPIVVSGGPPKNNRVVVSARTSSHALSALLLVGPAIAGGLEIRTKGPVASRPYVDLTTWTMRSCGIEVDERDGEWRVPPGRYDFPYEHVEDDEPVLRIIGDWSSAAFPLGAAAASGGDVEVTGLEWDSPQADRRFVEILGEFGAEVERTADGVRVRGRDARPLDVDLGESPDLAPLVGALGCIATGTTRVRGAAHLRIKESDRIAAVVGAARELGCAAKSTRDGFEIVGPARHGGLIATHGDHRMAMAFAVTGLTVPGVVIDDPRCVAKSYPGFWDDLAALTSGTSG